MKTMVCVVQVVTSFRQRGLDGQENDKPTPFQFLRQTLSGMKSCLSVKELSQLIEQLENFKKGAEVVERDGSMELLLQFLQESRENRNLQLESIKEEISCLDQDIDRVEAAYSIRTSCNDLTALVPATEVVQQPEACSTGINKDPRALSSQTLHELEEDTTQDDKDKAVKEEDSSQRLMECIQRQVKKHAPTVSNSQLQSLVKHPGMTTFMETQCCGCGMGSRKGSHNDLSRTGMGSECGGHCFKSRIANNARTECAAVAAMHSSGELKRKRLASQFEDLRSTYLRLRTKQNKTKIDRRACNACEDSCKMSGNEQTSQEENASASSKQQVEEAKRALEGNSDPGVDALNEFSRILSVLTECNKLRIVAEIPRPSLLQSSSIISSVEFDRDGSLFASAGVSKRISIFERSAVLKSPFASVHCPIVELVTCSKLSCLSWNRYIASQLLSSDYEGGVTLWDVSTKRVVQEWEAHERRIWSVDFCDADPKLIASGSDDCRVKIWSSQEASALTQLELPANVTTVKWRPDSSVHLAIGSADHSVYLYDLRHAAAPMITLPGHRKAVSYVKWASPSELVSASTDSTLRLWGSEPRESDTCECNLNFPNQLMRVFEGHINEKNFVGLATEGDLIACGSETNELYVYHKQLRKPISHIGFSKLAGPLVSSVGEQQTGKVFVSAVSWRPESSELLTADSQGTIRLVELYGDNED